MTRNQKLFLYGTYRIFNDFFLFLRQIFCFSIDYIALKCSQALFFSLNTFFHSIQALIFDLIKAKRLINFDWSLANSLIHISLRAWCLFLWYRIDRDCPARNWISFNPAQLLCTWPSQYNIFYHKGLWLH